ASPRSTASLVCPLSSSSTPRGKSVSASPRGKTPRRWSRRCKRSAESFLLALAVAACSSSHAPAGDGGTGGTSLVIGVQAEDLGSLAARVRVRSTIEGQAQREETFDLSTKAGQEVKLDAPDGHPDARVDVQADALYPGENPIVSRAAWTRFVPGQT